MMREFHWRNTPCCRLLFRARYMLYYEGGDIDLEQYQYQCRCLLHSPFVPLPSPWSRPETPLDRSVGYDSGERGWNQTCSPSSLSSLAEPLTTLTRVEQYAGSRGTVPGQG